MKHNFIAQVIVLSTKKDIKKIKKNRLKYEKMTTDFLNDFILQCPLEFFETLHLSNVKITKIDTKQHKIFANLSVSAEYKQDTPIPIAQREFCFLVFCCIPVNPNIRIISHIDQQQLQQDETTDESESLNQDKKKASEPSYEAFKEAIDELNGLVGLDEVKETINELIAAATIRLIRNDKGIPNEPQKLHMIFRGNPGSAKTTVARLLCKILYNCRAIPENKFVECGRADIIGKYVGWTAQMVKEKIQQARGGIIFIDEAYSLIGEGNDYGSEAINTIVQEMENDNSGTIFIFAGYPKQMDEFITQNEGLRSRIPYILDFPDYSTEELMEILTRMANQKNYIPTPDAMDKCKETIKKALAEKNFGNGRFVRNMLDKAIAKQATRLISKYNSEDFTEKLLVTLEPEDFKPEKAKNKTNCIKFNK